MHGDALVVSSGEIIIRNLRAYGLTDIYYLDIRNMRQSTFPLSLLLAIVLASSFTLFAQETNQKNGQRPLVILGREAERCETLLEQLRAATDAVDFQSLPVIETEAEDFVIPSVGDRKPVFLFTSPRGVEYFFAKETLPKDAFVVALGKGTQRTIEAHGAECHLVSSIETTKGMAEELANYFGSLDRPITDFHFIQPTCDIAGRGIQKRLESLGAIFTRVESYRVIPHPQLREELSQLTEAPRLVLFYSPSGVRAWKESSELLPAAASIGPVTSKVLKENGFEVICESPTPHEEDLVATVLRALSILQVTK